MITAEVHELFYSVEEYAPEMCRKCLSSCFPCISVVIPPAGGISLPVFPNPWQKEDVMCFMVRVLHS